MRDLRWETSGSEREFPGDDNQWEVCQKYLISNHTSIVECENFEEGVSGAFCGVPRPLDGYAAPL